MTMKFAKIHFGKFEVRDYVDSSIFQISLSFIFLSLGWSLGKLLQQTQRRLPHSHRVLGGQSSHVQAAHKIF